MTNFVFHHNPKKLPEYNDQCHPVQMYDKYIWNSFSSSSIARPLIEKIRDLGCRISKDSFDFLTIAMAVTAADTFSKREDAHNSWARELNIQLPLLYPEKWKPVSKKLEEALGYLTGDMWSLDFTDGGLAPPSPKTSPKAVAKKKSLKGLDCVCLFSGGLDSAVGAIDLINGMSNKPLLVSHAYKGDASKQNQVESVLLNGKYSRLSFNADPHIISHLDGKTDITMRGRSFNFIAMAVVGMSVVQKLNGNNIQNIIIPENGYISLNPPLTRRRIGSLSTRTTHPHFLTMIENILNSVGIGVTLKNPYQYKTKGEMIKECIDQKAIGAVIPYTVSCSNWHRKGIQCGRCVPCLIRRSAVYMSGFKIDSQYDSQNLAFILKGSNEKDDLLALVSAYTRLSNGKNKYSWVRESGPLPSNKDEIDKLVNVFDRGLKEVGVYLNREKIL